VDGLAEAIGVEPLAGTMFSGAALFAVAGALIIAFLRPDPRDMGRAIAAAFPPIGHVAGHIRPLREIMRLPAAQLAALAMVFGQVVMVLVMSVVSLHMHHHQHGLGDVSLVIMAHTLGMYGLSVVTGPLADRIGRPAAIASGAGLLIGGSLLAPASLLTPWIALAMFMVGLGWNLCYIAGSSLLSDLLAPSERGQVQGANDLAVNLVSATSSLSSGIILATIGFGAMCLLGAALAAIPLALLAWQGLARARLSAGEA
jgi:MFS family permease